MNEKISKTEMLYTNSMPVDKLSAIDALNLMLSDHEKGILSVRKSLREIEKAVKLIYSHIKQNDDSKIIYCGAGTSGRIGVQDGAELYPTFGWPQNRVGFIIAGGIKALTKSFEGAEDNIFQAQKLKIAFETRSLSVFLSPLLKEVIIISKAFLAPSKNCL